LAQVRCRFDSSGRRLALPSRPLPCATPIWVRTAGAVAAGKQQADHHWGSHRVQCACCTAWACTSTVVPTVVLTNVLEGRRTSPTLVIPGHWVGSDCTDSRQHRGGARLSGWQGRVVHSNFRGSSWTWRSVSYRNTTLLLRLSAVSSKELRTLHLKLRDGERLGAVRVGKRCEHDSRT
jgi:hypothetical protein